MKKILFAAVAVMAMTFVACDCKTNSCPSEADSIVVDSAVVDTTVVDSAYIAE